MTTQEFISEVRYEIILWVAVSTFATLIDFFICSRFPPAEQPKAVRSAARIELCSGGFLIAMAITLMLIDPFPALRIVFLLGLTWVILSWILRRGHGFIRWVFVPLSLIRLLIPIIGWIASPLSIYYLFINREAKDYFKNNIANNEGIDAHD